ncbi:iron-containing redox enzyme family protein [Nonomuraea sp. FMUSA5-5]|uniref:Iron-containing redox enzyme family protein n=1 Tax=Nonomuraea composti TaxID=2720023 RepID=A0ABX1BBJ0_9ACTN|nr:iron-containing redox enzyme family protein [Nonomuraea sp. FMUSA5-5]NJP94931.1 iron-containing redox enzyme family protein [Nonomuraea sp. FMUSA5-5]
MRLPAARGPITAGLFARLAGPPCELDPPLVTPPPETALDDGDLQLALFACYELHSRGFDDVNDLWEWQPSLLATRRDLERCLEAALAHDVPRPPAVPPQHVRHALTELVAKEEAGGLSPAALLWREAGLGHEAGLGRHRELVVHRAIHHLKVPAVFGAAMTGPGLDDSYGVYLPDVPGITLAVANVRSLFGLHRRLRGALAGHLAALEPAAAPSHLENASDLAAQEPSLTGDILYGAACALTLERRWAEHVLSRWRRGLSSLEEREPAVRDGQEGEAVAATS